MRDVLFLADVLNEVCRARKLFPSNRLLGLALAEEAGETIKALMDIRQKKGTKEQLYDECVQTAAMACRLAIEGDDSTND